MYVCMYIVCMAGSAIYVSLDVGTYYCMYIALMYYRPFCNLCTYPNFVARHHTTSHRTHARDTRKVQSCVGGYVWACFVCVCVNE